jgi:NADH-quinone oxidoreductase subunit N
MGSLAGFILFGICLIYGAMGTFDVTRNKRVVSFCRIAGLVPIELLLTIRMFFQNSGCTISFPGHLMFEGFTYKLPFVSKVVAFATLFNY